MFRFLALALSLINAAPAMGEPYSRRPDVLSLKAGPKAELPVPGLSKEQWEQFKHGTLRFLAEMEALYPNDDYYFLARDGEYLYDAMRVLAKDNPTLLKRIRLINVSRLNAQSSSLRSYLTQEGLTPAGLQGRGAVLIDTCCMGTMPDAIKQKLPELGDRIKSHFITSSGPNTPSSRVFLESLTPGPVTKIDTSIGLALEKLPHFTGTALSLKVEKGRLEPHSAGAAKPEIQKASKALMWDIKRHFSRRESKQTYATLVSKMSAVAAHARGDQLLSPSLLKAHLEELSAMGALNFVSDLEDAAAKGTMQAPHLSSVQAAFDATPITAGASNSIEPGAKNTASAIESCSEHFIKVTGAKLSQPVAP